MPKFRFPVKSFSAPKVQSVLGISGQETVELKIEIYGSYREISGLVNKLRDTGVLSVDSQDVIEDINRMLDQNHCACCSERALNVLTRKIGSKREIVPLGDTVKFVYSEALDSPKEPEFIDPLLSPIFKDEK